MTHPTIESIRKARREIAAEQDFDPQKLGAYYRQLDEEEKSEEMTKSPPTATGVPREFLAELTRIIERLEQREEEAKRAGMDTLASKLSGDRARLAGLLRRRSAG